MGALFGPRAVVMVSGAVVGGSLILASFASNIGQITIVLALGLGKSFIVIKERLLVNLNTVQSLFCIFV